MKLTAQIQLFPDTDQAGLLKATVERFNEAADWLAEKAFAHKTANKILLQKLYYRDLRDHFGLSAQMACLCISQVSAVYKRDKTKRPRFRSLAAVPYDKRIMGFKGIDRVSLLTLEGRVIVPMLMGEYQRERFTKAKGQCDLVLRQDGKWFLLATVDVPDGVPIPTTDFLGVDLGMVNIASTDDGEHFSGSDVETCRQKYHARRKTLQKIAALRKRRGQRPKQIRRALRRASKREANFRRDTNHSISKRLVAKAKDSGCGIALEALSGIRTRIRFRKAQRARMSGWAFSQLREFIAYKAGLAGIAMCLVDPRDTSKTCSVCGHCEHANRPSQSEFVCQACGHTAHADTNGARNIRARALVMAPLVSEKACA